MCTEKSKKCIFFIYFNVYIWDIARPGFNFSLILQKERHDLIEEYETSLFRLLHCYILEKIKLNPEDIAQVERVYDSQLQAILVLDDAIVMHKRLSESYFSELKQLQESRILPFFSHIAANGGCSLKMISLLLENVSKDLDKISNDVRMINWIFFDSNIYQPLLNIPFWE